MLTFTRKVLDAIRVGDEIRMVLSGIQMNQARISFIAPRSIQILRSGAVKIKPKSSTRKGKGKLSLTLTVGDVVSIGADIKVEVMEIHRGSVRIGICAPREIPVDREEIWFRKNLPDIPTDSGSPDAALQMTTLSKKDGTVTCN